MRYDHAFGIGSVIEGTIKCTWVELFDKNGEKLFSLQNRNFSRRTVIPDGDVRFDSLVDTEQHNYFSVGDTYLLNLAWTNAEVFEAVVRATKYVYAYKVPVTLTTNAVAAITTFINQSIAKCEKQMEDIEADIKVFGEDAVRDGYRITLKERYAWYEKSVASLRKRISILSGTVYVKPKAIDWHPLNTNSIVADYSDALAEYEKAKRIMAVSAASIII